MQKTRQFNDNIFVERTRAVSSTPNSYRARIKLSLQTIVFQRMSTNIHGLIYSLHHLSKETHQQLHIAELSTATSTSNQTTTVKNGQYKIIRCSYSECCT